MANITVLEIETGRLQSDIDSLKMHLEGMRQTGDRMMTGINALSAMWEGEAKNAFTMQFQSDYQVLRDMADAIEKMILALEEARNKYDKCESSVGSIINAIRV